MISEIKSVFDHELSDTPCPRCLKLLLEDDAIQYEAVMLLPAKCPPQARDGSGACCYDCQAADTVVGIGGHPKFAAARLCTANEQIEHLRLPKGITLGLVMMGIVRPCSQVDLARHQAWLRKHVYPKLEKIECCE